MKRVINTLAVISLLMFALPRGPIRAFESGQQPVQAPSANQYTNAVISDTNFAIIAQQVRDLKNPTFRALLRVRIVSWIPPGDNTDRHQAALSVTTEGLSDLCAHQDEVWTPTASWLYESLTRALKNLDPAGADAAILKFTLKKDESSSDASRELALAVNTLSDPAKSSSAGEKAKAAILTGQVPAGSLLGHLLRLQSTNPSSLPDLLSAILFLEEQQPGFIPLRLIPFFTPIFLGKSSPTELQTRFLLVAIRSTRLRPEDFADPTVRTQVVQTLRGVMEPTRLLAPDQYPEVATRLNAVGGETAASAQAERQAAEDRIKISSDQLEQIESEADKTNDKPFKRQLLARGAQLALNQGKLRKAVDLAIACRNEAESYSSASMDPLLAEVHRTAIKQKQPEVSVYAISKMEKPLNKANGMLELSRYYAQNKETEKHRTALNDSAKLLKQADNDNSKLRLVIALAQSFLAYDRPAVYDAFQLVVDTINQLPAPEKAKEQMYYVSLMPIAEGLIRSFRLLAAQDGPGALAMAQEIKLSELRVAAVAGVYSRARDSSSQENK
ncbi:MAG TPA: hypothetical protein DC054_19660 [Blastocatellia bacterium]|nr:hypothetical protein [Blastocatellia bacterium]